MKHVVFGTAGHIDHGKSALVMALTGTDPDRWAEEKRRGITIDLGFAHFDSATGLRIALIDVPGHERFVHNMLAGATGIDAVLLVIAADESIKPQTREHFDICRLLGVRHGLVAMTKRDLVDSRRLEDARREIQQFVAGSFLEGSPMIEVSARTGEGLDALKREMLRLAAEISAKPANQPFRLPVDRAFVIQGFGSVVTGTLIAGKIETDAEVELLPAKRLARVRRIEVHNQPANEAVAGQRTALNLAGIEVGAIHRGMMLARPGEFEITDRLGCALGLLPSARLLKDRARIHFHCWTAETLAETILLDRKQIKPGEECFVSLRLRDKGLFLPGDRFIIRQLSPAVTIGGGVVIDNFPAQYGGDRAEERAFLESLEQADDAARLAFLVRQAGETNIDALAARTGWGREKTVQVALQLDKKIIILDEPPAHFLDASAASALSGDILHALACFHEKNALRGGMPREELRGRLRLGVQPLSALAFGTVLSRMKAGGKIQVNGQSVALAGRGIQLSAAESDAKNRISQAFERAGLRAPSVASVLASLPIDSASAGEILRILLQEKTLVKVTDDLIFHHAALDGVRSMLASRKSKNNRLSVADFKDMTGVSRKYAIPLLEYLDRERITRRSGEDRVIL